MTGRDLRLRRLRTAGGAWAMLALDHGASMGPIEGLADARPALAAAAGTASCVTVHKGIVPLAVPHAARLGILMHLSASTDKSPDPDDKRIVATVEEAVRLGCDGVSIHVNFGSRTEARQVEDAGRVSTACNEWGMPLLAMMYPRGRNVKPSSSQYAGLVAHAARLGAELGADAVKVPYTGSAKTFHDVVAGCPVPVLVAGGPRRPLAALLTDLRAARRAGAQGFSVGRNVFAHKDPLAALRRLVKVFE